jgi:hypothetical protein
MTRASALLYAGMALLLHAPIAAAYWELVPEVSTGFLHETNPRFTVTEQDATGTFIDLKATGAYKTPQADFRLTPRIRKTDYLESNKDLSDDDFYVDGGSSFRRSRFSIGVNGYFRDVGVRTSEFEAATPIDPDAEYQPSGASGRIGSADDSQTTWSVSPYLTYVLSPRNQLGLNLSTSDTEYSRADDRSYYDYTYDSGSASLTHTLDAKNALTLRFNASTYTADAQIGPFRNASDSYSLNVGYQRTLTPTWNGEIYLGTERSKIRVSGLAFDPLTGLPFCPPGGCSLREDDQNFIGDLSLFRRAEKTNINFGISRFVAPQSNGTEYLSDQARIYVQQNLSPKLTANFALLGSEQTVLGGRERQEGRYLTFDTSLRWRIAANWSLSWTYTYYSDEDDLTILGVPGLLSPPKLTNNRFGFEVNWVGTAVRR